MSDLRTAAQQALAFTMRDFASLRDFEAAKAVLQDSIRSALVEEEKAAAWLAERKEHWRKEKEKIQATDPELSAALGWPGGISNPVLDRKVLLQMVAALCLASQQALEALERLQNAIYNIGGEHVTGLGVANDAADSAEKPMGSLRAALAQQAEPAQEPVAWAFRHSDGTYHDPSVTEHSAGMVPLYPPTPQRKPLTEKEMYIVEEEARKNFRLAQAGPRGQMITYWDSLTPWLIRAVERAHGIKE